MVETGAEPRVPEVQRRLLKAARALTTPLLPDDYIELMNPMWSTRELRGLIEGVRPETADASTVVVRPNFDWPGHLPGQYLRIGVEINGVRHWRAYSLTSDPITPTGWSASPSSTSPKASSRPTSPARLSRGRWST